MCAKNLAYEIYDFEVYSNQNQLISESLTQNWTPQAVECYSLSGNCKKCSICNAGYSFKCKMNKIVDILLEKFGQPNVDSAT